MSNAIADLNLDYLLLLHQEAKADVLAAATLFGLPEPIVEVVRDIAPSDLRKLADNAMPLMTARPFLEQFISQGVGDDVRAAGLLIGISEGGR